MGQQTKQYFLINLIIKYYFISCTCTIVIVTGISEFDLPIAKIYQVDENDKILKPWDKIINSETIIESGINSLRLECTANHPVQWIYSGNGIPVSSSKITVSRNRVSKEYETVHKATIFINPLKEHHTGKYQCSSTEILDLDTYFYIYVPGQALFTSLNGKNIHIHKNDTKILIPCTVSNPNVIVTLEKQVGPILQHIESKSPETVVYNPKEGFTIKLDELIDDPEGIFVCTAKYNNLARGVEYTLTKNNNYYPFQPEASNSNSACNNHTCGDNAICSLINEQPTCQCEEMFIGDADESCNLKCEAHTDCPDNKSCFTDKECRSPCIHSIVGCGINSLCKVENHRPVCYCGPDYVGDPKQQCFTGIQGLAPDAPPDDSNKPSSDNNPILTKCKSNEHCNIDQQCRRIGSSLQCVDGCLFIQCGLNSKCSMVNHNPMCSCEVGFNGDPYNECGPIRLRVENVRSESITATTTTSSTTESCENPENCGPFSKCRINKRGRQRCTCQEGYLGQPPKCTPNKCETNHDCLLNQVCSNLTNLEQSTPICLNVCGSRICGEGAECLNNICQCTVGYVGDPFIKCVDVSKQLNKDCTIDNECGDHLRCETGVNYRKCVDPCNKIKCSSGTSCLVEKYIGNCLCPQGYTGNPTIGCTSDFTVGGFGGRSKRQSPIRTCSSSSCGLNSECRIIDEKPKCFCQSGYIGTPPFCRAECLTNIDCPAEDVCKERRCQNACLKKCGTNAKCKVVPSLVRSTICTCDEGYKGNANIECILDNS